MHMNAIGILLTIAHSGICGRAEEVFHIFAGVAGVLGGGDRRRWHCLVLDALVLASFDRTYGSTGADLRFAI